MRWRELHPEPRFGLVAEFIENHTYLALKN